MVFSLPNLTSNLERIIFAKIVDTGNFHIKHLFATTLCLEFLRTYDYALSYIIVLDLSNVTLDIAKTFDLNILQRIFKIYFVSNFNKC